jgi:hypothetical protein
LGNAELHQGEAGKYENEERKHFCSTPECQSEALWPMGQEYHSDGTSDESCK